MYLLLLVTVVFTGTLCAARALLPEYSSKHVLFVHRTTECTYKYHSFFNTVVICAPSLYYFNATFNSFQRFCILTYAKVLLGWLLPQSWIVMQWVVNCPFAARRCRCALLKSLVWGTAAAAPGLHWVKALIVEGSHSEDVSQRDTAVLCDD